MFRRSSAALFASAAVGVLSLASCSDQTESPDEASGPVEVPVSYAARAQSDLLFVIDDSGSMCGEQESVAAQLDQVMAQMIDDGVDLHVGVTTTSPGPDGELGELNTRPDPVPNGSEGCEITSNLVEVQLERAVACTTSPGDYETTLTDAQSTCIDEPANCEIVDFELADVFPAEDAYRPLPPVLRMSSYMNDDSTLRRQELLRDFACMSMVGTRGSSFEKGFGALLAATSPDKVGAAWDPAAGEPADAPNYGLVRDSVRSAAFIISDENDCTYDNDRPGVLRPIDEQGACGDAACTYANSSAISADESPLLPPEQVRERWLANLTELQGSDVTEDEIALMSAHGVPLRYDGEWPGAAACEDGIGVEMTCTSSVGRAYSGDRYQRFVELFPAGRSRPQGDNPAADGKICASGGIADLVSDTGSSIPEQSFCLNPNPIACSSATDCAMPLTSGAAPACEAVPGGAQMACTSSLEVKITASASLGADAGMQRLVETDLCDAQTTGTVDGRATCFMGREFYSVVACPEFSSGITVQLTDNSIERRVAPFDVSVVLPEGVDVSQATR